MIRRKWLTLSLAITFGLFFWAFTSKSNDGPITTRQQQLLTTVGLILQQRHFSPKSFNDAFSKEIFRKFIADLDADKNIFLQSDINQLKKYETTLDDEIQGSPIQFFPAANTIYTTRIQEVINDYRSILGQPFDFNIEESVVLGGDKTNFPATASDRKEKWRKYLKFSVLETYADLQDERDKSKIDSVKSKTNADLEKQARTRILTRMDKVFNRLRTTVDDNERFNMYVNTIAETMDPHTNYLAPIDKRAFDEQMSNRFYGIGAQLGEEDGKIKIVSLVTGGPAWKSGQIAVNDYIIKVGQGSQEGVDISGYEVTDAVKLIRGNKNSEVRLTIKKSDGTTKVVSLVREEIKQDEAAARSVIVNQANGKKIGYINLPEFYADFENPEGARSSVDIANELVKLKAENVDGIVLDLRNNGGGSLYEVVQMVGLFIPDGPVVQVKDKDGQPSILKDNDKNVLYDGPLAVMVNEFSASASEIFAAAIQDYNRGIIIGSTSTYGKGTVQRNIPFGKPVDVANGLTEFGALKITQQKFYRINGGSTQLRGVTPDIIVPDTYEYLKFREKDNEDALAWDEIQKANYQPWTSENNLNAIKRQGQQEVNSNSVFQTIRANTAFLDKRNSNKTYSLNLNKYRQEEKQMQSLNKQNDSIVKLRQPLDAHYMEVDKAKFEAAGGDKAKASRYAQWLTAVKSDLYIDEAARIVSEMLASKNNLAKKIN
ncbi:MAG: tail-specific protease precursor [Chitinophagaceae bacterium]|nr:tail-specific protease precursor [Chitinophagaceae bacterium]